jgi:Rrf2 family nitric oxide-sensitive transcriptional repressor
MDPEKINLGKIIVELEPDLDIAECFNESRNACHIFPVCRLKKFLDKAKKAFLKTLGEYTLADVIKNKSELKSYL